MGQLVGGLELVRDVWRESDEELSDENGLGFIEQTLDTGCLVSEAVDEN
jgi:hypothetical protein